MSFVIFSIYRHRPDKVFILPINIDEPEIVQGLLRSHPLDLRTQQSRYKDAGLATIPCFYFGWKNELSFDDIENGIRMILTFERSDPSHKFIDGDA